MNDLSVWTVDRLAARNLFAALKLECTEAMVEQAAEHLAGHRRNAYEWATERVVQNVINTLETASTQEFVHRDAIWADGFRYAEQCLLKQSAEEALGLPQGVRRSKGQILRSMIRQAKRESA